MNKIVIAVDGPAGSGKSSVCKRVALDTGLKYIDSGAIYRTITLYIVEKYGGIAGQDPEYAEIIKDIKVDQVFTDEQKIISFLNGRDVSGLIRDELINANIGKVSDSLQVRSFVNNLLKKWAEDSPVIMDGRDIGSIVFPEADLKIYLDASPGVRAERRINEYKEMGKTLDEISVKKQIILRDQQDMSREYGRLVRLPDAVYIDSSGYSFFEVVDIITGLVKRLISEPL